MFEIKIWVVDSRTGKKEKPTQYNTFWDETGRLKGIQDCFKIQYEIVMYESEG